MIWLLQEAGPAFKGDVVHDELAAHRDDSRSGRAFRIAVNLPRQGLDFDDFEVELKKDADLAVWAADSRQVKRAWANSKSSPEIMPDDFDDLPESLSGFAMSEDGVALASPRRSSDAAAQHPKSLRA